MKEVQKFMMIFNYVPNPEYRPTAEDMRQMKDDWGSFIGNIALKEKLESTYQLGFEGKRISNDFIVSEGFMASNGNTISGNMVVTAHSLDEAVEMAKDSPILKMGGSVEVRSILSM